MKYPLSNHIVEGSWSHGPNSATLFGTSGFGGGADMSGAASGSGGFPQPGYATITAIKTATNAIRFLFTIASSS
jgi:hypothetical protein